MDSSNYEIIQTMYDDLKREQLGLLSDIQERKGKIAEIDAYLNSLLNKEESDLRVFLPRKVEDVYHDVIEQSEQQKRKLISECDELERQLRSDENRMEQLDCFLSGSSMLHVKQLSILDVQEKERQRIARDLHDTSLQNLTHLVHKVELSSLYIDDDPVKAKLELAVVEKGIRRVIEDIRNSIFDLRPMSFDDLGLKETIEKLLNVLNQERRFNITSDIDPITMTMADASVNLIYISMYRIVQECVQNAIRHSGGDEIAVKLKDHGSKYWIEVRDNGTGFDVHEAKKKEKHFGLSVIEERVLFLGGRINIDAHDGTFIEIEIPKI